ncbi:MAG TPA: aspartate aminotransferase family protein [Tenuifilaceae bacterium]|nr:aspartate aminotransferase family protein [Tenuifilaceae bacterium]HPI45259.1 aspartate aminotransferase family protein [Tenuifilaceae bacterium]HPN21424.1 aspartate aminotransferase family protein [Tenuifilaceae bacterium]
MLSKRQLFLNHVAQTSDSPLMLEVERAEGVYLFGPNGEKHFDLISGVSVSNVGHSHPKVVDAVKQQVDKYMHLMVYGEFIQNPQVQLATKLASLIPKSLDSVYFLNSGSEAIEGAMKLAKRYTGRTEIVSFKNAYHGSTQGSLSIMGGDKFKQAFRPLLPDIRHLDYNNAEQLNQITSKTACVIVEPIQGEAGVVLPKDNFLSQLRERCSKVGALLVFDEIQTGLGRTGKMFAFENYNVTPDILVLAKALGGGMPLGAFIASKEIMWSLTNNPVLGHITTFGGHPVSCTAALASINVIIDENLVDSVNKKEKIFREILEKHPLVKEVRSKGLLMAVELSSFDKMLDLVKYGVKNGFITDWFLFCDTSFRISPPLTITDEECRLAAELIVKGLNEINV